MIKTMNAINFSADVGRLITKFGSDVTLKMSGGDVKSKAFIELWHGKSVRFQFDERRPAGRVSEAAYLFLAPPDVPMETGGFITAGEQKYYVVHFERVTLQNVPVYTWAAIKICEEDVDE